MAIAKVMAIREQLRPYIMEQYQEVARSGTPIIRPLFFDFEADPVAATVDDEMMFGHRFLVAPQMVAGAGMPTATCPHKQGLNPFLSAVQQAGQFTCQYFRPARAGGNGSLHRYIPAAKISE